uniref:Uncharacterized protein n=1 Tax=Cacopsylla melanoneura TaxID=428564 RepID=A0A8D8RH75_9HEMI
MSSHTNEYHISRRDITATQSSFACKPSKVVGASLMEKSSHLISSLLGDSVGQMKNSNLHLLGDRVGANLLGDTVWSDLKYYVLLATILLLQGILIWLSYLLGQYHGVSAASRYAFFAGSVDVLQIDDDEIIDSHLF